MLPAEAAPNYTGQRRRILRRSRIDGDLIAIIDKALQPDPAHRYPDAGALAADLKAFKAGARISARRYSLGALLAHWTRRHRALAFAATTALLLVATGVALYTRNIAVERDRADAEAHRAQTEKQAAEQATSDLLLQHAETLMRIDPTAAAATLEKYRGSDTTRLRRLQAEAKGRGLPVATFQPHSSAILFLTADSQGAIYSIGFDGKLRVTDKTGSTTLASNVSTTAQFGYARTPQLLAYKTVPTGLAVFALSTRTTTTLDAQDIADVKIAPDGSHLATLGSNGLLTIWALTPTAEVLHREPIPEATELAFTTSTQIVIKTRSMLATRSFASSRYVRKAIPLPGRMFGTAPQRIVAGDEHGNIYILSTELTLLASSSVCQQGITDVRAFEHRDLMAFGCAEGAAGIAHVDPKTGRLIVVDRFRISGAAYFARPDEAEERVVASSYYSNQIYIYDIATRMVSEYKGRFGLSRLFPGSRGYDRVLVGDTQGAVQAWDPPSREARVLLRGGGPIYHVRFSPRGQTLVTDGDDHIARMIDLTDGAITELRGHTGPIVGIEFSLDGREIVTMSVDRTLRVWRASDGGLIREFNEHRNVIRGFGLFANEQRVASIDEDGRLLGWTSDQPRFSVIYKSPAPLLTLEISHFNNHIIVMDATSSLWDVSPDGEARQRRYPDGVINDLRMSPDSRMLAIGTDTGDVTVYETVNWTIVATAKNQGPIQRLAFEPHGRALAIASKAGKVHILPLGASRAMQWRDIQVAAHSLVYAPDGEQLAISCDDGSTWFYDARRDIWVYTRDHDVESFGSFSLDGRHFASADRKGVVVLRDTEATFMKALHP